MPFYPGGEAVYLYGYEMMNQIGKDQPTDASGPVAENALGEMSYRSSLRVPYFINGNLENITGHDWYWHWHQFVADTRARAKEELRVIRAQPVTVTKKLTHGAYQVVGSAFSPDGNWLAYTGETLDDLNSLYVRNLKTGRRKAHRRKNHGRFARLHRRLPNGYLQLLAP